MKILSKLDNTGMIEEVEGKRFVTDAEKAGLHTHTNITALNNITEVDGELRYNGEKVITQTTFTWARLKGSMSWAELIGMQRGDGKTMKYTTNLSLKKPDYIDPVDIQDINSNMDIIDSAIQSKANSSQVMPISGGVLENYREKLTTVSAANGSINLSLGNVFQHTPSSDITYSITNAVNGQAHSFTLKINMGSTVRTLTFPSSVKWQGGEIPDLTTANKTYVLTFMTTDGGSNWLGMFGGEF